MDYNTQTPEFNTWLDNQTVTTINQPIWETGNPDQYFQIRDLKSNNMLLLAGGIVLLVVMMRR